jgi:hypothetical protein
MKRFYMLAAVFVAAAITSIGAAASASAVEFALAIWLENSNSIITQLAVESEGELEYTSLNSGGLGIKTTVLCSGIMDGWVSGESLGHVSELLTLAGVAVPTTTLTGTPLLCTNDTNCTEPEVWGDVPFETEAELMEEGTESFFVNLLFKTGWYVQCLILGTTVSELCEAEQGIAKLTNETNGTVDGELSEAFQLLAGGKLATCTLGGTETGEINGLDFILAPATTLSVAAAIIPRLLIVNPINNPEPIQIEEHKILRVEVEYDFILGGKSGVLSVSLQVETPFAYKGGSCNTKEITAGEKCTIEIECTGVAAERGELTVKSNKEPPFPLQRKLECIR